MPGILHHDKDEHSGTSGSSEFDRKQVLKNTELNAQLGAEGERIREQLRHGGHTKPAVQSPPQPSSPPESSNTSSVKKKFPKTKAPTALKSEKDSDDVDFDEANIEQWNEQRGKTQKILEPNTPYMGTAADTEYYDDDPVPEDLDLGGSA